MPVKFKVEKLIAATKKANIAMNFSVKGKSSWATLNKSSYIGKKSFRCVWQYALPTLTPCVPLLAFDTAAAYAK